MKKKIVSLSLFVLLFGFFYLPMYAQSDSVLVRASMKYSPEFRFKDGIYISYEHFKNNNPIPFRQILSPKIPDLSLLVDYLANADSILFADNEGKKYRIATSDIWGFSRNGFPLILYNGEFNRIPILGAISHFVANKTFIEDRYVDPYSYRYGTMPRTQVRNTELHEYLLDFESGKVVEFDEKSVAIMLMRNPVLYDEYNELSKSKKRKLKYVYLRKYNELNPIYIPIQ